MKDEWNFSPKSAWKLYRDDAQKKAVFEFAERYRKFLGRCKTERETVLYVADVLRKHGFSEDPAAAKTFRVLRDKAIFVAKKGDRPLEEALSLFEEGTALIKSCGTLLNEAEQRVVKLQKGEDGEPVELPFETIE